MSGIFELCKLLAAASAAGGGAADRAFVESAYKRTHHSEQAAGFDDVLYAASCMDLLSVGGGRVSATRSGREFVGMMSVKGGKILVDGNPEQRRFLLGRLWSRCMRDACGAIFKKFSVNYAGDPPEWNARAGRFDGREEYLLKILEDAGVVRGSRGIVAVDNSHLQLFSMIRNGVGGAQASSDRTTEGRRRVGELGEKLSLEYEIRRLKEGGSGELADMVKRVSATDPYAGYDIASFDGAGAGRHDRFIEAKATSGAVPKFFWSLNEARRARELGDAYWVYLWTDVDRGSRSLQMIQNPYRELFETGEPTPDPSGYFVGNLVLDHASVVEGDGA